MKTFKQFLLEHIVKVGSKFELVSHKGKNLGKYPSKAGAAKREKQVEYFKSLSEMSLEDPFPSANKAGYYIRQKNSKDVMYPDKPFASHSEAFNYTKRSSTPLEVVHHHGKGKWTTTDRHGQDKDYID